MRRHRSHRGLAVSLLVVLAAAGCSVADGAQEPRPPVESAAGSSADLAAPSPPSADDGTAVTGDAGEPVGLRIPAIDLDKELMDLGLTPSGSLEVPAGGADVGWFTHGGRPGGPGPTVIAGHVDSKAGPAVFYRLTELQEGDVITIQDAGGESFDYVVDHVAQHSKDEFPTAEVFGSTPDDQVRLITCGGAWDQDVRSYEDNHIVYASPLG